MGSVWWSAYSGKIHFCQCWQVIHHRILWKTNNVLFWTQKRMDSNGSIGLIWEENYVIRLATNDWCDGELWQEWAMVYAEIRSDMVSYGAQSQTNIIMDMRSSQMEHNLFNVFVIPKITSQNQNQKLIHSRNCNLKEWKFYAIITLEFLLFHIYFDRLKKNDYHLIRCHQCDGQI